MGIAASDLRAPRGERLLDGMSLWASQTLNNGQNHESINCNLNLNHQKIESFINMYVKELKGKSYPDTELD